MKRYIRSDITDIFDEDLDARLAIANNFTTNRRVLERLKNDPEWVVRSCAKETLVRVDDGEEFLTMDVQPNVLETFSKNGCTSVRYYVARHPNTSDEVLQKLAEDADLRVREAAKAQLFKR